MIEAVAAILDREATRRAVDAFLVGIELATISWQVVEVLGPKAHDDLPARE